MLLAHGIGGVEGLPLDGELVLQTGGAVVLTSFLAVALLWRRPRFTGPVTGRPLPAGLAAPWLRNALQALMLALAIVVVGLARPQDPDANPARAPSTSCCGWGSCRRHCCPGPCGGC